MQGKIPVLKGCWKDGDIEPQSPAQSYLTSAHLMAPLIFLPLPFGPGTGIPLVGMVNGFFLNA